jgi:hypothetical protein
VAKSPVPEKIRRLDPVSDPQRIVFHLTGVKFPLDTTRALEIFLFRTFAVPRTHFWFPETNRSIAIATLELPDRWRPELRTDALNRTCPGDEVIEELGQANAPSLA